MQEDGDTDSSNIQQVHSPNKLPFLWCGQIQEDHKVDVKSEKVLSPQVKEFYHFRGDSVKVFVLLGPSMLSLPGIFKACDRIDGTEDDIRKEHKQNLDYLSNWIFLEPVLPHGVVIR